MTLEEGDERDRRSPNLAPGDRKGRRQLRHAVQRMSATRSPDVSVSTPGVVETRVDAFTYDVQIRLLLATDIAMGPGKADLLTAIKETGSISAAGRRLGMSYK